MPAAPPAAAEPAYTIVISADPFGYGFGVEIIPPPEGIGHDREFRTHKDAYGYASGLRLVTGWVVRDLCDDGASNA
jgi:hypothetical protein